jgi:hypothetical protein
MFRALLAYLQKALHKRHLIYCVGVMSVGCYQDCNGNAFHSNPGSSQITQQVRNIPSVVCGALPEDE